MSLYTTIVTPFVSCCIEYQNSLHYSPMNRRIDPISISYKSQGKCLMEIRIVVLRRPFLYYWSVCMKNLCKKLSKLNTAAASGREKEITSQKFTFR